MLDFIGESDLLGVCFNQNNTFVLTKHLMLSNYCQIFILCSYWIYDVTSRHYQDIFAIYCDINDLNVIAGFSWVDCLNYISVANAYLRGHHQSCRMTNTTA